MALTQTQEQEIQDLQTQTYSTRRDIAQGLEEILYEAFPVLDHGFVRVMDYMGNDSSIVQAARVSYGKGTKKVRKTEDLFITSSATLTQLPLKCVKLSFTLSSLFLWLVNGSVTEQPM